MTTAREWPIDLQVVLMLAWMLKISATPEGR